MTYDAYDLSRSLSCALLWWLAFAFQMEAVPASSKVRKIFLHQQYLNREGFGIKHFQRLQLTGHAET